MTADNKPEDEHERALDTLRRAKRVLIARADDLGDNVLAASFPKALAQTIAADVGFIGTPAALDLMDVAQLSFVAGIDCRPRNRRDVLRAGLRYRREVAHFDPDVVVLPRYDFEREALGIALIGLRPRTTITWCATTTAKRARRSWWLHLLPGPRLSGVGVPLHEFDRLKCFAQFVGVDASLLEPELAPELFGPALERSELDGVTSPMIAIGIGAAQARRRWPSDRFAAVIKELGAAGFVSVLVGSPDEEGLGTDVCRHLGPGALVVNLVGKLRIRETAQLIARCALYVGNDSGIGHVAAAVHTPTVTISCHPVGAPPDHITSPDRYHPIGDHVVVRPKSPTSATCADGCAPVFEPCCILRIPADDVVDACRAVLGLGGRLVAGSDVES